MPPVGVAQGRARGAGAGRQAAGLSQPLSCPLAGVRWPGGRGHAGAPPRLLPHWVGFEELQAHTWGATPLSAPDPGCWQPQSQGWTVTPGQQDGIPEAQDPSFSQKATVLGREGGCLVTAPKVRHAPHGSVPQRGHPMMAPQTCSGTGTIPEDPEHPSTAQCRVRTIKRGLVGLHRHGT